jgi:hypothetical protein
MEPEKLAKAVTCEVCDQEYDGTGCKNPNKEWTLEPCPFRVGDSEEGQSPRKESL